MALSRSEAQSFFRNLGKDLDNREVKCFKCDFPLYYSSLKYKCENSHTYSYEQVVFKYSGHLEDIKNDLAVMGGCSLQLKQLP